MPTFSAPGANLRRYVRRLAVYWPLNEGAQREILRQLILAVAHENRGQIASCMEAQSLFRALWGIDVETHEISIAIRQLVEAGKLIREQISIRLAPSAAAELARRVRTSKQVEAEAFQDWDRRIRREIAPSLGESQRNELQQDLITWINVLVIDQGIAAAAVLYPEQKHFEQRVEEIKAYGFDLLPERDPSITMVRASALQAFFTRMTEAQRSYINHMASTAYLMSALTLDSAALPKIRRIASGQRLYLDTNIIYSLLGLHGRSLQAAVQRVVDQCRELGYLPTATPWTVNELRESVCSVRNAYARLQVTRQLEPRSAPDSDGHEVLMRQLRKLERDRGISPEHFLAYQEQVEDLLEDLGIEVIDEGCQEIDDDPLRLDEEIARLEQARRADPKPRPLQEHDVKHRLLIEAQRGPQKRKLSDAESLMLTHDQTLLRYANAGKDADEPAFAVGLRGWRQMIRTVTPRTTNFDQSVEDLIGTRSVAASEVVDTAGTIEAIFRITDCEDLSPNATTRAMFDSALGTASSESDADLENAAEVTGPHEAALLRAENLELRQQLIAEERAHAETKVAASAELDGERRERDEAEALSENTFEVERLTLSLQEQKAELKRIRWFVAALLALAGVATLALPLGARWITHGWPLVADICGSATIEIGALAWLYGRDRAWKVASGLGVLATIVAAVQSFVGA